MEQKTIAQSISIRGKNRTKGIVVNIILKPAPQNYGIVFIRTDLKDKPEIKVCVKNQQNANLSNSVHDNGANIYLIEHIMAAIWAFRITDLIIEIDQDEMPILEGSSDHFIFLIRSTGLKNFSETKINKLRINKEIIVHGKNNSYIQIKPYSHLKIEYTIDFAEQTIGQNTFIFDENLHRFSEDLSACRTFCTKDAFLLVHNNFKHWTKNNSIIFGNKTIESGSNNRLKYNNESCRHKVLDLIGDLMISEYFIEGHFECYKSGHSLNAEILKEIFKKKENYVIC